MILMILIVNLFYKESFNTYDGLTFGYYYPPQKCNSNNYCFPGNYFRSELYSNMCEPRYGGINKIPIQFQDDCLRTLEH
jgi:hypothetical protein